jgi:hypothetical protein
MAPYRSPRKAECMTSAYRVDHAETLTLDTITALSRAVAGAYDERLRVVGVTSTDGESGRVELIVTIHGCHVDPCIIMLNVTRSRREAFERELRDKFRDALASHVTETS